MNINKNFLLITFLLSFDVYSKIFSIELFKESPVYLSIFSI